jgi:predicted Zn-dependent protease
VVTKLAWALPGGVIGGLAGWFAGFGLLFGFFVGAVVTYLIVSIVVERTGAVFGMVHNPQGETAPLQPRYSRAEALVQQGKFQEAIDTYLVSQTDRPDDPEPFMRIARICRDKLQRHDEAVFWFKQARSEAQANKAMELLIAREIMEVYAKMGEPRRAIPELARLLERFPDDPSVAWAKQEMNALRKVTAPEDVGKPPTDTR